jgi:glycosyltransferase involved in cell wall biosynthesis
VKMKILHVGPIYSNRASGPSGNILGLAKGQASIGCSVGVLSSEPIEMSFFGSSLKNIVFLKSPAKRHFNPWLISKRWIKIIEDDFGKPDIINFHDTYIPFETALARIIMDAGWPYIFTPRGGLTRLAQNIKFFKKKLGNLTFFDNFINNAKAMHALCDSEASDIRYYYPQAKVFVVPNGIDEDLFSLVSKLKIAKRAPGADKDLIIFFMGRIDVYHKGLDLLVLALKMLQEKGLARHIKLLITGPFYRQADECTMRRLTNSLKFPDNLEFTGPAYGQKKWELLMACDVFVHTSRFEGMPTAVLEAMALGKPCIVTPGTNVQEIISRCNGGWLCDESISSIANTLIQVEKDKDAISKLGLNALSYVKNHLTWPIVSRQYIDKLSELSLLN